jgi:chromosome segregation ATPase
MESSQVNISLQSDVSKLGEKTDKQNKDLETLRKNFNNLSNLYNVSEKKLKLNESNLGNISKRQSATEKSLTGIQKKLDENSVLFANEKKKLLGEIKALKGTTGDIRPRLRELTSELTALTKKHDDVKKELLGKLKEQRALNQTRFEKLNAENEARGKQYEKDVSQLRRDLDVTRALADRMEDEAIQAQNALQKQEQRHEEQEKHNKARFKVLFDYQTNVDRQIKIQEKKATNFAQLKRIRVMPDKAKALRNFRRGRYALLEEFV